MRPLVLAIALAAGPTLPALAAADEPAAGTAATETVRVGDFFFRPGSTRIEPGDTVEWSFVGQSPHTATSRRGAPQTFDSGELSPGDSFSRTFDERGRYPYVCTLHPWMRGVVQVGSAAAPPLLRRGRSVRGPRRVRIAFTLSETARVGALLKRVGRPGRRRLPARRLEPGRRALTTRLAGLPRGAYTARIYARDADGTLARLIVRFRVPRGR